jgi:catechol 2,3-dioxygenase-like lactoylglutathione lyase family enzyme
VTVRGIDHAGIAVASLEAALHFYRDLLGLGVTDQGEDGGPELDAITGQSGVRIRYAELDLGAGQVLEVIEAITPAGMQLTQQPSAAGAWNGVRCVYVEDPDGRTLELVQRPA